MVAPIAGSSAGMQEALSRIATIEGRFGVAPTASLPPMPGSPALPQGDGSFAQSLSRAAGTGGSQASSATFGAATASSTRATTIGMAAPGAGNVRGLSALATTTPVPSAALYGTPTVAGATPATGATYGADTGARAVELAKEHLGVPYKWGGTTPAGFDCSGLLQHTYRRLGVDLPRVSRDQAKAGQPVASLAEAKPGDLVAFGHPVDHIGIYAGNNQMVVAPHTGAHVRVQTITRPIVAIRRVA